MTPSSREELKEYCLRQLGWPVIQVNISDDQIEDRIDEAFQFFTDFHYDGVEKVYTKHQITEEDKANEFITIPDSIVGVTKIFPYSSSSSSVNMFDLRYQLRLHDLYDFTSVSYVNYTITMQHLRTLEMLFSGEQGVRFNKLTNKLYIDWDWKSYITAGEWIIIEGEAITDPEAYSKIYNDRMLKKLTTAYIKKNWGGVTKKYGNMQLPGGITINGKELYDEAVAEIADVENEIRTTYQQPLSAFLIG